MVRLVKCLSLVASVRRIQVFSTMRMKPSLIHHLCGVIIAVLCLVIAQPQAWAAAKAKKRGAGGQGLSQEWEPSFDLKTYKQNYLLLYALSSQPNNQPTSPNPLNQVLTPYALDNRDMKFQISLKYALADNQAYGSFWFAYTQLSFWQFYDKTNSQPFRGTDYSPEFIYSLQPFEPVIVNFGAVHQSNGEATPRSRSWNRMYIEPAVELIGGGGQQLVLQARWWQRFEEDPLGDDNADIHHYLGYREVELRYCQEGGWQVSAVARSNSAQLDIAAPLSAWLMLGDAEEKGLNVHLQYFSGYGESLLDYNQGHVTWGLGLSIPFN